MRFIRQLGSLGGVFLIAVAAVVAAVVGRFTYDWVFIPVFIGVIGAVAAVYYLCTRGVNK